MCVCVCDDVCVCVCVCDVCVCVRERGGRAAHTIPTHPSSGSPNLCMYLPTGVIANKGGGGEVHDYGSTRPAVESSGVSLLGACSAPCDVAHAAAPALMAPPPGRFRAATTCTPPHLKTSIGSPPLQPSPCPCKPAASRGDRKCVPAALCCAALPCQRRDQLHARPTAAQCSAHHHPSTCTSQSSLAQERARPQPPVSTGISPACRHPASPWWLGERTHQHN